MNTGLIFFTGIIAVLALLMAWAAFNRSGQDVLPTVEQKSKEAANAVETEVEQTTKKAELAAQDAQEEIMYAALKTELEARLLSIRAGLVVNEVTDETISEIQELRKDMAVVYENSEVEAQAEINEIDAELELVEQNARENTSQALLTLEDLIELVRQDVSNETPQE